MMMWPMWWWGWHIFNLVSGRRGSRQTAVVVHRIENPPPNVSIQFCQLGLEEQEQSEAHIMSDVSDWWLTMMALTWWLEVLLKRRILHFVMTGFGFWTCVKHSRNFLLFSSDWSDFGRRWRWLRTDCHVRGWHSPQVSCTGDCSLVTDDKWLVPQGYCIMRKLWGQIVR